MENYNREDEVGPNLRLQSDDPEWMAVVMKQITDSDGDPSVFNLCSDDGRLKLSSSFAHRGSRWVPTFS